MTREVWTDISGYEGLYQLSNLDRVRSLTREIHDSLGNRYTLKGKEKKLTLSNNRYLVVLLHKKGKAKSFGLHQLKLMTYVSPCPEGMEACHNNGNALDNNLSNLRWDTPTNNQRDREKHGTNRKGITGIRKLTGKTQEVIDLFDAGMSTPRLAEKFGVSVPAINYHLKKKYVSVPRSRLKRKGSS